MAPYENNVEESLGPLPADSLAEHGMRIDSDFRVVPLNLAVGNPTREAFEDRNTSTQSPRPVRISVNRVASRLSSYPSSGHVPFVASWLGTESQSETLVDRKDNHPPGSREGRILGSEQSCR